MNNKKPFPENAPGEYFDETSFKTLYGGVFITWVTTNTIVDLLGVSDPKLLGFIIALIVAFAGFLMSEKRTLKRLLVTPFNGFLIYLTIVGGTSFLPPPEADDVRTERIETITQQQAAERAERTETGRIELESAEPETAVSERPATPGIAPEISDPERPASPGMTPERADPERPASPGMTPERAEPERPDTLGMTPRSAVPQRPESIRREAERTVPDRRSSFTRSWN